MTYTWAVAANLAFVGVLMLIFANAYDDDTRKILAALVLVLIATTNKGNSVGLQVANLTTGVLGTLLALHKKAHPGDQDKEIGEAEALLKGLVDKVAVTERKLLVRDGFGIAITGAMLLILIS